MGFPTFAWIWKEIGVDSTPWRSELTIPVRLKAQTLLMLRDAKGVPAPSSTQSLDVYEVKQQEVHAWLWAYLDDLDVQGEAQKNLLDSIQPVVQDEVQRGVGKLLAVTGKVKGLTQLQAGSKTQNIDVIPGSTYKVSFRFQQMVDNTGDSNGKNQPKSWTDLNTSLVDGWLSHLNWIFGSQANIKLKLVSSGPFRPAKPMIPNASGNKASVGSDGTTSTVAEQTLSFYEQYVDDKAEDTVFLTGRVDNAKGFTLPPLTHKSWETFVPDRTVVPASSNVDQFILLLAHELSHAIQHDRSDGGGMHFCEDGILRSQGRESTIIGDLLRPLLVGRGGTTPDPLRDVCVDSADHADKVSKGYLKK